MAMPTVGPHDVGREHRQRRHLREVTRLPEDPVDQFERHREERDGPPVRREPGALDERRARIGEASTRSTMPIAANALRSVRLDAAIETDVSAADTAMPDTRIRSNVATQLAHTVGTRAVERCTRAARGSEAPA